MVVGHHVVGGIWIWVLSKSSQGILTVKTFLQPQETLFQTSCNCELAFSADSFIQEIAPIAHNSLLLESEKKKRCLDLLIRENYEGHLPVADLENPPLLQQLLCFHNQLGNQKVQQGIDAQE